MLSLVYSARYASPYSYHTTVIVIVITFNTYSTTIATSSRNTIVIVIVIVVNTYVTQISAALNLIIRVFLYQRYHYNQRLSHSFDIIGRLDNPL